MDVCVSYQGESIALMGECLDEIGCFIPRGGYGPKEGIPWNSLPCLMH